MIEKLACKLGRNDEIPNIELAEFLSQNSDAAGIKEIVSGLTGKDKAVANDCIKVLYEIGERKPELICEYANDFIYCLYSKNNRLVWGSMIALAKIVLLSSQQIYDKIDAIMSAYENGSTITVDNSISVFAGLCRCQRRQRKNSSSNLTETPTKMQTKRSSTTRRKSFHMLLQTKCERLHWSFGEEKSSFDRYSTDSYQQTAKYSL